MRDPSKRLDVCLGDFAVSIQGYDDPLSVLEEVLTLGQKVLAETPELLNTEAAFGEAQMSDLIERVARRFDADPDAFGAVPGIVLVHKGAETDPVTPAHPDPLAIEEESAADEPFGAAAAEERLDDPLDLASIGEPVEDEPPGLSADEHEGGEAETAAATPGFDMDSLRRRFEEGEKRAEKEVGSGDESGDAENIFADPDPEPEPEPDTVVNIFDDPDGDGEEKPKTRPLFGARGAASGGDEPVQMPDAPDRHVDGGILGDRFESLLKKVHGKDATDTPEHQKAAEARRMAQAARATMTPGELAQRAGAEDGNDALLTAAAFLSVVKRQSRFTRKELMATVDDIPGEFPRTLESRIKGIGKLVRDGTLKRVDDTHYGLSREMIEQFEKLLSK